MKSRALIIEDDKDTASLFSNILEFIGFTTEIIESGERALVWLKEAVPDIVLLDILLSQDVSGINILDYIRANDRLSTSRVIVITGYSNLAESVENMADLVLLKPISAKQLSTMVLRLVPNHVSENFLYNASHDPLTGLMNYARFKDRLIHAVSRTRRDKELRFGLLLIQLSGLTGIRETHGSFTTNQILTAFTKRILSNIREVDTFARFSEDKFAILLENIQDPDNTPIVSARIQKVLDNPFQINGQIIQVDTRVEIANEHLVERLESFLEEIQ